MYEVYHLNSVCCQHINYINPIGMKKRRLLLSIFVIGFGTVMAQHHGMKHHHASGMQETAVVEGIGVVPVYKVLVTQSGKAMSARDWASMKTMKMQEILNLDNKQAERLYKVNLGWAKDTRSYHAEKHAMKDKQIKKMMKREKKFTETLSPTQLAAYNSWKKQNRMSMDVKSCKMKGHGKRMIISCRGEHFNDY